MVVRVKIEIRTTALTSEQILTPPKSIVCINLFNRFQRFHIDHTQGTVTNTGFYATLPPKIHQVCLNLESHEFTQDHLFPLITSRLHCVYLSERIAKGIAKANDMGFVPQFYHMLVNVVVSRDLFVSAPVSEEETQKEEDEEDKEEWTCSICLQGLVFKDDKLKMLHCPHGFHLECINMWLIKHNSCPLCRGVVVKESDLELDLATFPQKL